MSNRKWSGIVALCLGIVSWFSSVPALSEDEKTTPLPPAPTEADLAYFQKLSGWLNEVPNYREVSDLASTTRLDLWNTKMDDPGMVHLRGMSRLVGLSLNGLRITDAGLAHIAGLTRLEELNVGQGGITDAGLVHLAGMTHMKKLVLIGAHAHGPGFKHLRDMLELEELNLACTPVDDEGLENLKRFRRLRVLDLCGAGDSGVTDVGLSKLAGLIQLESLNLMGNHAVTDAGLSHLKGLTRLARLELSGTSVRGQGLEHLGELKSLKWLRLGGSLNADAMKFISRIKSLEELDLENARELTPEALDRMEVMPNLRSLTLPSKLIGPRYAKQVEKHPRLNSGNPSVDAEEILFDLIAPGIEATNGYLAWFAGGQENASNLWIGLYTFAQELRSAR